MTNEQIREMTNRFLAWKLPADFHPDAGISFVADYNVGTAHPMKHEPCGTNLLTYSQAEIMVRHMVAAIASGRGEGVEVEQGRDTDYGRECPFRPGFFEDDIE